MMKNDPKLAESTKELVNHPLPLELSTVAEPAFNAQEAEEEVSKLEFLELPIAHDRPVGQKLSECLARFEWDNSEGSVRRQREIASLLPPKDTYAPKNKSVAWALKDHDFEFPPSAPVDHTYAYQEQFSQNNHSEKELSAASGSDTPEESQLTFIELPLSHEPPAGVSAKEIYELTKWNSSLLAGSVAKQREAMAAYQTPSEIMHPDILLDAVKKTSLSSSTPPSKMEMENQLDELFAKFNAESQKGSLARHDRIMVYICQIVILLARISGRNEREEIQDIQEKLHKNIEKQVGTYGTFWQTAFTITSVVIQVGAAFMGVAPLGGAELFGKSTEDLAKGSQAVSGLGSGVGSLGSIAEQFNQRDRTLYMFEGKQEETLRGERDRSVNQADQTKSEALRAMQTVVSSLHEIANKLTQ